MHSEAYQTLEDGQQQQQQQRASVAERPSYSERPSYAERPTESSRRTTAIFDMVAIPEPDEDGYSENMDTPMLSKINSRKYNGRLKMWPGIILLVLLSVAAVGGVLYYGIKTHEDMKSRTRLKLPLIDKIDDGTGDDVFDDEDLDKPGNPSVYPDKKCAHVDYVSKNNFIYAVTPSGEEVKLPIKGINWSGMETSHGIPYGLWDNAQNGTTVYQVVAFLARNKFNSVRLPLSVDNLLKNIVPNKQFINAYSNEAIEITSYRALLKTLISAMAYRGVSVLLDLHTLTPFHTGEYWYSPDVPEKDVLEAIDILGEDLCHRQYWNIVGLDLKNEPSKATWASGPKNKDWHVGATTLGNKMLKACPQWTAFVEGIAGTNSINLFGKKFSYTDWWGGGLSRAGAHPVVLNSPDKVVWSPHYYSPSVFPAQYFYRNGRSNGGAFVDYEERDDDELDFVVNATMHQMFGYLGFEHPGAIVMGEFGGLYGTDDHPKLTTKRVIDYTIKHLVDTKNRYAGGYVWSLNPESGYEFNPVDTIGHFQHGLLDDDWLRVHKIYLKALKAFDKMDGLQQFPCFSKND